MFKIKGLSLLISIFYLIGFNFNLPLFSASPSADGTVKLSSELQVKELQEGIWLHTSYKELKEYGLVPANGLLAVTGDSAVLIDLPWTDRQTASLFDWAEKNLKVKITAVIPTHSHQDCIGGLREALRRGAEAFEFSLTARFAQKSGYPEPQFTFTESMEINSGDSRFILDFPGGGHTRDNIVVYLPKQQILFGGCLVKPLNSRSIGFIKEADLESWPLSLKKVKDKYGKAKLVIPGHGAPGTAELLTHSIKIVTEFKKK